MPRVATTRKSKATVIAASTSKEQRKKDRQQIGRLRNQVVNPKTEDRYLECFNRFCQYHRLPRSCELPGSQATDELVSEFIEMLWESGETKSLANYSMAAIQFFRPQTKHHLPWSWKLVKVWNSLELPQRATPLSPELLLSLAGQSFRWQQMPFGWLLIVGFTLFLRTGELLNIKAQDVVLKDGKGVLFLPSSKGAKRHLLPLERVEIVEQSTVLAFKHLLRGKKPGDFLWNESRHRFMTLWREIIDSLKLSGCNFYPYSLRRGGASSAYRQGASLDLLVTKGRWSSVSTARIYLDLGLQSLANLTLPTASQPLLLRARQHFSRVSQTGTHGRGVTKL